MANGKLAIIGLWVDDAFLLVPDPQALADIKSHLMSKFEMVDLGPLRQALGLVIDQRPDQRVTYIHQRGYAEQVLARFGYSDCNPWRRRT